MAQQRVAAGRRVAQAESRDGFGVQAAIGQIGPRGFAFGVPSSCRAKNAAASRCISTSAVRCCCSRRSSGERLARPRHGDAAFFGHRAHRLREIALVHLHHELENVAAGAAAEAVVDLLDGMDGERRRLFGVKWAQAGEILAALFQAHVFADHADDVRLLFDAIGE